MKNLFFILILVSNSLLSQTVDSIKLKGPYLGQKPPETTVEIFAPEVISTDLTEHGSVTFSPDGKEVFWAVIYNDPFRKKIMTMRLENNKWTAPEIALFSLGQNEGNPFYSPDGNNLYFDLNGDIWVTQKEGNDWSEAAKVTSSINSDKNEKIHGVANNGSIYFSRFTSYTDIFSAGKNHGLYVARKKNDHYSTPVKLNIDLNSVDVFVAPDESYMIFEYTTDRQTADLYITYILNDGSWSERINLNLGWGRFPSVSPDGKYLFYMSNEGINWVNTSFIEQLKPKGIK